MLVSPLPLILTLKLDAITFNSMNQLRQQHFPPEKNLIPAHVTLFHKLPGEQNQEIRATLHQICEQTAILPLLFPKPRFLGKGVAIVIESPQFIHLQEHFAELWGAWLSKQDQQRFRPHVTVQNKVAPEVARDLYDRLTETWKPLAGKGEGLLLWRYLGGPWELVEEFGFKQS